MGLSDQEVVYRIVVDSTGAVKGIQQVGESFEDVRKAAEKSRDGFTGVERGLIVLNQAADLAVKAFKLLTSNIDSFVDAIGRGDQVLGVQNAFNQLAGQAGETASVFQNELREATQGLISDFDLLQQTNRALLRDLSPEAILELAKAAETLGDAVGKDAKEAFDILVEGVSRGNARLLQSLSLTISKSDDLATILEKVKAKVAALGKGTDTADDELTRLGKTFQNLKDEFSVALTKNTDLVKSFSELNKALKAFKELGLAKEFAEIAAGIAKIPIDILTEITGFFSEARQSSIDRVARTLESVETGLGDLFKGVQKAALSVDTQEKFDEINQTLELMAEKLAESEVGGRALEKVLRELSAVSDDAKSSLDALTKTATDLGAVEPPDFFSDLFDNLGLNGTSLLSGLTGLDIGALGEKSGAELGESISKGISEAIGNGVANAIGQAFESFRGGGSPGQKGREIGTALFADFGILGRELGGFLGEEIGNMFEDDPSLGTRTRDAIKKFFDDIFIDLKIPSAAEFVTGTFDDALRELPDNIQGSFSGVGLAFEQLIGVVAEKFGIIGPSLLNTVGADLNELQLLVARTGISFEQLSQSVVDAFLQGKVSFLEAQTSLIGIQQIAQKGIPGAMGAVTTAFENFIQAGTKGGLASVDALQDIGAEALELSLTTLPEVQAQLEASGLFTAESIQQTFEALSAFGIDTIDELQNLSNETAIAIGSQLQAQNFPFEETAAKIDDLLSKLEDVPTEVESNIRLNVSTKFDSNTTKLVDSGADLSAVSLSGRGEGIASA